MKRKFIKSVAIATVMSIMLSGCAGCAGCNENDTQVNSTPTAAVTATTAPTATVEATKDVEPTIAPAPTDIPATPTPLPTPEPTATPIPTNTPVPVIPEEEPICIIKMGDNVWYDFYEDGTLVVRGTGATYSFYDDGELTGTVNPYWGYVNRQKKMFDNIEKLSSGYTDKNIVWTEGNVGTRIIIKEGITEIGSSALATYTNAESITFPSSLKKIDGLAFYRTGADSNTKWIGLNTNKVEIASTAFLECGGGENIKNAEKYSATPTPTPRPTATPLPNPDKPRLIETRKMGDNVTYEFWDNGYLYVKGTGATWNQSELFGDFMGDFYQTIKVIVVEEGITSLGDYCLMWLAPEDIYFPKGLKKIGSIGTWGTIHGYYDGKAYVATGGYPYHFFKYFQNEELAQEHDFKITWE